ncbi:MAG: hypothetical protein JXQ27_08025 [Acidobacteria bacterium]|nr:hypothetical protein [Acidobacteriota bacterium]
MTKIQDGGFRPPIPPADIRAESKENTPADKTPPAAPSQAERFPDKVQEHAGRATILDPAPATGPSRPDVVAGGPAADTPELTESMTARFKMARLNPAARPDTSMTAERIVRELKTKPEPARLEQLATRALTHFAKASGAGQAEMQAHQAVLESARSQWEKMVQDEQPAGGSQQSEMEAAVFSELTAHFSSAAGADPMAALFGAMKESVEEVNKDKKYALEKLQSMNEIAEAYGDYLQELQEQSAAATGEESDGKTKIDVRFPRPPGSDDVLQITRLGPKERVAMSSVELDAQIGDLERLKNEIDDVTQMEQLNLQSNLQKSKQLMQTISNILKALSDTSRSLLQNMK